MNTVSPRSRLEEIFALHASRPLIVTAAGRKLSYAEFLAIAQGMGAQLLVRGLKPGERLLIQLENSEYLLALYVACALTGVVACPVDPLLPERRVNVLKSRLSPAWVVDEAALAQLMAPANKVAQWPSLEDDADFLVVFSSGSTGEPKGIVHSLKSMLESARSFAALSELSLESITYHHFPMYYMAGIFNQFFCPLSAGAAIVIGPKFSKMQMLRFWEMPLRHGVNNLTLTPTMALSLAQLFRADAKVTEHLSRYQAVVATGGPLYASIAKRFLDTFNVPLRSCYGVTEIGGSITLQSWEDALALQSLGRAAPETHILAGSEAAPAEIRVRTPFMAKGYLQGGKRVDFRDKDGYFPTGDLGYLLEGLLYFAGREHDLVKKGGEFVSTQQIEDVALRNSGVTDIAVVGVPDEYWGARVVLFYVPRENAAEADILAEFSRAFAQHLRAVEHPDKIIPVPWMPKTSIGKIVKRELVDKYTLGAPVAA